MTKQISLERAIVSDSTWHRAINEGVQSLNDCRQRSFNDTATVQRIFFAMLYVSDHAIREAIRLRDGKQT